MYKVTASLAVVVVVAALGFGVYQYSTSGESAYALRVNGKQFTPGDVATQVAFARVAATAEAASFPDAKVNAGDVIRSFIEQEVQVQEAERRGLTCSPAEASAQEATQVARGIAGGQTDAVLISAVGLGLVPPDYLRTPAAQRTPSTADALAAYLASPAATDVRDCEIGKLYAQVRAQHKGEPAPTAEAAIGALRDQLVHDASVDGPALTPTPEATATATPMP